MGQKINPKSLRIGIIKDWDSKWFTNKKLTPIILEEDFKIREYLDKKLKGANVASIGIERLGTSVNINIFTARPGVIIGRGGEGVGKIKTDLEKIIKKHRKEYKVGAIPGIHVNIEEVKSPMSSATIVGQMVAESIEKRMPYRRTMKKMIEQVTQNKEVKGLKIKLSGRLDGAEISRSEWLDWGKMPLQTLRADIDYAKVRARCTYGTIGIKVWIYKGEVFNKKNLQQ
jgi:small subunit ribosomal protein S3